MGLSSQLARRNLHVIPTLVCLITPITFIATFVLSVHYKHVFPFVPYISDTGANFPESCLFSQFVNVAALLLGCCVYVRGRQVDSFANFKFRIGRRLRLNTLATYVGYCSCLGLSIVANFQVNRVKQVHYIGAAMCFLGGGIYFILQTIFSYHMGKEFDSKGVFLSRVVLCTLAMFFLVVAIVTGIMPGPEDTMHWGPDELGYLYHVFSTSSEWLLALTQSCFILTFIYLSLGPDDTMHWGPDEPGYLWHVLSTSSEWLLALTQSCLVLTFFPDFKPIKIHRPEVYIEGISSP